MLRIPRKLCPIPSAVAFVFIGLLVGACGVKSTPQHPSGSGFPMAYPQLEKLRSAVEQDTNKHASPSSGSSTGIYQYPNSPSYKPPRD